MLTRSLLALTLGLAACAPDPKRCDRSSWEALLLEHAARYPSMDIVDALKLVQQAATGSEHAVDDPTTAAAWLRSELANMGAGPMEAMVDTLGRGGRFARVHLRPWRATGGDADALTRTFVATAALPADTVALTCALDVLVTLVTELRLPWDRTATTEAIADWNARGRPAMHHSSEYEARYRPAYRVVAVDHVHELVTVAPR